MEKQQLESVLPCQRHFLEWPLHSFWPPGSVPPACQRAEEMTAEDFSQFHDLTRK